MTGSTSQRLHLPTVVAAALGVGLLIEILRLWFPAVAFIFGRAGSTDPLVLGLFALTPFVLAFGVPSLVRWRGTIPVLRVSAGVLVTARFVTQFAAGGDLQLWATTVGVLAGFGFVVAAASGGLARAALAVGLIGGLAFDAALEALLAGGGLDWMSGPVGYLLLVPLLALFVTSVLAADPAELVLRTRAWPWLLLGPTLALHLILGGVQPALVAASTDTVVSGFGGAATAAVTTALLVAAYALAVRYAVEVRPARARPWVLPLAVAGAGAGALFLQGSAGLVLLPTLLLALTLGPVSSTIVTTAGSSRPVQHGRAVAGGLMLLFLVSFPYYASYDLPMGVWNGAFVLVATAGLALGLLLAARHGSNVARPAGPGPASTLALVSAIAVVVGGVAGVRSALPDDTVEAGFPLRVALANVHMGYSVDGRYVGLEQAAALRSSEPDVVVLNEVDRGWALNGGQDVVRDLARGLDMPYVFTPAADDIWGNAILTRLPILETGAEILPDSGGYMVRSAIWVVLDAGGGREVAVIGTHLHHRGDDASIRQPQARRFAELATDLARGGRPVVLAGDLNARADSPDLAPISDAFRHAAGANVPDTYPSTAPERDIDHVYVSPDLRVSAYDVVGDELSDHLWVLVQVSPAG